VEAKATIADMLVALEVDTPLDKLSVIKIKALVVTLAYRVKEVDFLVDTAFGVHLGQSFS